MHGIYILPDSIHDDMYTLMLRSKHIMKVRFSSIVFLNERHLCIASPCYLYNKINEFNVRLIIRSYFIFVSYIESKYSCQLKYPV